MLAEDPHDVFLRYSLALELQKEGQHEASLAGLGALMRDTPPYVPAFFMSAQQLVSLGRVDASRAALREGIEEARRQEVVHFKRRWFVVKDDAVHMLARLLARRKPVKDLTVAETLDEQAKFE